MINVGDWVVIRQIGYQGQIGQVVSTNRNPFAIRSKYGVRMSDGNIILTGAAHKVPQAWIDAWNAQTWRHA